MTAPFEKFDAKAIMRRVMEIGDVNFDHIERGAVEAIENAYTAGRKAGIREAFEGLVTEFEERAEHKELMAREYHDPELGDQANVCREMADLVKTKIGGAR